METYLHGAGGMFPCKPDYKHAWVRASDSQSEIARLQAEVERLREVTAILEDCIAKGMVIRSSKESGDSPATRLWNDAIEAAALCTGNTLIRANIRALRRP